MKDTFGLPLLAVILQGVLQVFWSLESWVSNDFQGTSRIFLGEVSYVHQVIRQNPLCCFPVVIELWNFKTGSVRRNWVPALWVMVRQSSVSIQWTELASEFWADLGVLPKFSTGFAGLVNAHLELPTLCTEVTVHTAVTGVSQHDGLLL